MHDPKQKRESERSRPQSQQNPPQQGAYTARLCIDLAQSDLRLSAGRLAGGLMRGSAGRSRPIDARLSSKITKTTRLGERRKPSSRLQDREKTVGRYRGASTIP